MKFPPNVVSSDEVYKYVTLLLVNACRLSFLGRIHKSKLDAAISIYMACELQQWQVPKLQKLEWPIQELDLPKRPAGAFPLERCSICKCNPCRPTSVQHSRKTHELNPKLACPICKKRPCKLAATRT